MMRSMNADSLAHRIEGIARSRQVVIYGAGRSAISTGSGNYQSVQPWIVQSWERCLSMGFEPERKVEFDLITAANARRQKEANQLLDSAAHSTLVQLGLAIAQTRYFAILTNAAGVVVGTEGTIDRSDRRAALISRVGADLSEKAVGTTAIGATLAVQHHTWLHQGEHFFQDTHCYSCAGAPIIGPSGDCVGMLDVTGIDVPERPELVHLVASSARTIENALVLATPHTLVVHLHWPGQHGGKDAEGLICLDDDGCVHALNPMARQMLGLGVHDTKSLHASDLFACAWSAFFDACTQGNTLQVPLWSGLQVCVRSSRAGKLSPKARSSRAMATGFTEPLKDHEVALIRHKVTQLKGNVAAAAKALGISRATVYRKLASHR